MKLLICPQILTNANKTHHTHEQSCQGYMVTAQHFSPPLPSVHDTSQKEAAEGTPPKPLLTKKKKKKRGRGGRRLLRLTGANSGVLPTVSRSLRALSLSLTRAGRNGVGGAGGNGRDVRKRGGKGESKGAEKTNRTEAAVCVRSEGSFRMFSTAVLQSQSSWRVICSWRCHLSSVWRSRATSSDRAGETDTRKNRCAEQTCRCAQRMHTHPRKGCHDSL